MNTDYHAKLFAHARIRRCPAGSVEGLIILDLIRRANELRHDVEALLNAHLADSDGY